MKILFSIENKVIEIFSMENKVIEIFSMENKVIEIIEVFSKYFLWKIKLTKISKYFL